MNEITLLNVDCIEYMAGLSSSAYNLAIVDPPYGIGGGSWGITLPGAKKTTLQKLGKCDYDLARPTKEYFDELARVAERFIVFGGNLFADMLPASPRLRLIQNCSFEWCLK